MLVSDIKVLSSSDIATALDRAEELFEVPEWGGAIKLRALSIAQRDEIAALVNANGKTDGQYLVRLIVQYGVSEPPLTQEIIQSKASGVIDRISSRITQLSGGTRKEDALTATRTFRPEPKLGVPVSPGDGPGQGTA